MISRIVSNWMIPSNTCGRRYLGSNNVSSTNKRYIYYRFLNKKYFPWKYYKFLGCYLSIMVNNNIKGSLVRYLWLKVYQYESDSIKGNIIKNLDMFLNNL